MRKFIKKHIRVIIVLSVLLVLAIVGYIVINKISISFDTTRPIQDFVDQNYVLSRINFLLVQIVATILLCFVPATSMAFILLCVGFFGATWQTFIWCFSGVILSSIGMDLVGRFGGSRVIKKLIGAEDYESALKLVQEKGMVYVPIMYLLPVFPDDAICMVCGSLKMKWWIHYIEILLCRGIGCATIVFGINIIPTELTSALTSFDWAFIGSHLWDYLVVATVIVFWVLTIFKLAKIIDKKITEYRTNKSNSNTIEDKYHKYTTPREICEIINLYLRNRVKGITCKTDRNVVCYVFKDGVYHIENNAKQNSFHLFFNKHDFGKIVEVMVERD